MVLLSLSSFTLNRNRIQERRIRKVISMGYKRFTFQKFSSKPVLLSYSARILEEKKNKNKKHTIATLFLKEARIVAAGTRMFSCEAPCHPLDTCQSWHWPFRAHVKKILHGIALS